MNLSRTAAVLATVALALTLYIYLTPGQQYPLDAAAVCAWVALAWEVANEPA